MAEPENNSSMKIDSSDDMIPRRRVKLEQDDFGPGPSSAAQKEPIRPAVNVSRKLHVKLLEKDTKYTLFDTNGKETIMDMVERMIEETGCGKSKPNTDFLLFHCASSPDKYVLNIGLPTGALSEKERYNCSFRKENKKKFTEMIRLYDVKNFDEKWNLSSFDVRFEKNTHFMVSDVQRIVNVVRVNYFPGESLFEALFRDGRFSYTDALHKSDFAIEEGGAKIFLSSEAKSHVFTITKRRTKNAATVRLEENGIQPRKNSGAVKQEFPDLPTTFSNEKRVQLEDDVPAATKLEVEQPPKHSSIMKAYFEKNYKLKLERQADPKEEDRRKKKIDEMAGKHYEEFALNYVHRVFVSDLEVVLKLKHSVGAIIASKGSQEECFGSCFRLGEKYVITNFHVWKDIQEYGFSLDHVDFSYKEEDGHCFNFDSIQPLLVHSVELDYAVLQLYFDSDTDLPLSVTELGYNIPNPEFRLPEKECLTLMGHPGEKRKQIDVSCPLRRSEIIEQYLVLSLRRLSLEDLQSHERRYFEAAHQDYSEPYDVSTFFEGSSGSPGLLMSHKMLVVLHCRGVDFPGAKQRYSVEEGILMSCIVKDVYRQKMEGWNLNLMNIDLHDIFGPLNFSP